MVLGLRTALTEIKGHGRRGQLQFHCFILTFLAHGFTFLVRKALAVIKHDLSQEAGISLPLLGWLDVALLLPVAVLQIFFVQTVESLGPRKVIAYSLGLCAASLASFGWWESYAVLLILLFLGGVFQALIFPYCIMALSSWYPGRSKSAIFGVWGICVFLGGIVGSLVSVEVRIILGWKYVFFVAALLGCIISIPVLRFLRMPAGTTQYPVLHILPKEGGAAGAGAGGSGELVNGGSNNITGSASTTGSAANALLPPSSTNVFSPRPSGTEVLMRVDAFTQIDRAMTAEEEQAVVSSGVYVIDSVPRSKVLKVSEVAKMDMVKEVAVAYFCVNVIRWAMHAYKLRLHD